MCMPNVHKSKLRSKNTQANLQRSTSKRFARAFYSFIPFFPCFFTAENKHSTGKVKRQIDSFDRTLRICIRAMAYGFSIAFACNENIKDKLTSRPGEVRANLTSCTAKWIVRSQINQTLFIPCIFKLSTKKKNRVSSGDSQRESE